MKCAVEGGLVAALRIGLLASTALVLAPSSLRSALAACDVTFSPNTVSCNADTVTTESSNNNAATASSTDRNQTFDSGGNVVGSIAPGVTVGGNGLMLQTSEAGSTVTFTHNGTVNRAAAPFGANAGISLLSWDGSIVYNSAVGAGITSMGSFGLFMRTYDPASTGDVTAHVNGDVSVSAATRTGVALVTEGNGRIVLDGVGNISGDNGISVSTFNATVAAADGDITVGGSGNVSFANGTGINIVHGANAGTVTLNRTGSISGTGTGVGISVSDNGTGGVVASGIGAISNVTNAILISSNSGITVTPGAAITAAGSGIILMARENSTATVNSAQDINAGFGSGISINAEQGSQVVNVTAGTISGGLGVSQYSAVGGLMTFNMSGGTILGSRATSDAAAVSANQNLTGDIVINQTGGTIGLAGTPTAAAGILGKTHGAGTIDITADRIVAASNGIDARVDGVGTVGVVAFGAVDSANASALRTSAETGATTITIRNRMTGGSASAGVVRATSTTGTISITNAVAGFIGSNLASPETQIAIFTSGGPTDFINYAMFTGRMILGNATNTVNNTTIWNTNGVNDFGSGTTTFTNGGTLNIGAAARFTGGTLIVNNTGLGNIIGPLTIDTGTWSNNALITGDVTLNGGVLGGTGTIVGTTTVNSGGVFAPGNSIGTTNVTGNVDFAGGTYRVEFSAVAADKTVATGTATLTGGTVQMVQIGSGFTIGQSYNISLPMAVSAPRHSPD